MYVCNVAYEGHTEPPLVPPSPDFGYSEAIPQEVLDRFPPEPGAHVGWAGLLPLPSGAASGLTPLPVTDEELEPPLIPPYWS
jgi:hypothetical protein